jgi:hypothetical protein
MLFEDFDVSLNQDSRGVTAVIGFLLVFSFIIILLSVNQAQLVPQENSQIEFQHYQGVQDDMVEVRSSVSMAGQADVPQYPTVKLGTGYPTRLFALNPPAPAGRLQTSDEYEITLQNASNSATVKTQFLVYRPGYNELDQSPIWYENSVLYIDARDSGGGVVALEDQNLIRGNSQLRINAIQNNFSVTSTGQVTVELYPTRNTDISLEEWTGDVTVEIPTRLTGTEYWDDELGGNAVYNGVTPNGVEPGIHLLSLTVDANSLKFNTVGIDQAPDGQGSASRGVGPGSEGQTENRNDENTGDSLPADTIAFSDENGNGVYDNTVDTAYSEADFNADGDGREGDFEGEDIIIRDDIKVKSFKIEARSVEAKDVRLEGTNAPVMKIETGYGMDLQQSNLVVKNGAGKINLLASQESSGMTIDIKNTVFESDNIVEATSPGGYLSFNQANGGQGTQILTTDGTAQNMLLCEGSKDGDGVNQPEFGTISDSECNRL